MKIECLARSNPINYATYIKSFKEARTEVQAIFKAVNKDLQDLIKTGDVESVLDATLVSTALTKTVPLVKHANRCTKRIYTLKDFLKIIILYNLGEEIQYQNIHKTFATVFTKRDAINFINVQIEDGEVLVDISNAIAYDNFEVFDNDLYRDTCREIKDDLNELDLCYMEDTITSFKRLFSGAHIANITLNLAR